MNIAPAVAVALALVLLAIVAGVLVVLSRRREAAIEAAVERLGQRLEELERQRHDDHAQLIGRLERRLGEMATAQASGRAELATAVVERIEGLRRDSISHLDEGHLRTVRAVEELRARFEERQTEAHRALQVALVRGTRALAQQLTATLSRSGEDIGARLEHLTRNTDERLKAISGEVEKRLNEGFEKTTATFSDVLRRLALIDEAQKKITELTGSVVSLQEVLADKRSRGAFGEVQLEGLVSNVMPPSAFSLQHTLSNGRRADCVLFLPEPTGTIAIDAKFPLESFQRMTDLEAAETERRAAERQFRSDVRNHVKAIAERYIIPGETSDGALMFVPAEAVFAEIQAHHPEVVQDAHRARVWMASPTTLVAILNTARAVLKDDATRRQVHVIRHHLADLARDFGRFQERMDRLATHIDQANRDVRQVHTSARKLSARFETIEKVEMDDADAARLGPGNGHGDGASGSG